ncbi:MAG: hypothetical protein QOF34_711 [Sphingomonadales bacterium]|nr:hypothetical protein [Sphingomonadales bacterium]
MLNSEQSPIWLAHAARRPLPARRWHGFAIAMAGAVTAGVAALIAALVLLPPALVFPVTALALLVAAASFAFIAWISPPEVGSRLVFWDVAGAMTVLGLVAALFGEPEQAAALIETDR